MSEPSFALSDEQRGAISTGCSSIKQSLSKLQKTDSRTRTYLGSIYERALSGFIVPLNLRLIKNNQPSSTLATIQADFITARTDFADDYTIYMRDMETLLAIDCKTNPDDFYQQLESTRTSRADLRQDITKLNNLLAAQNTEVNNIKESLWRLAGVI